MPELLGPAGARVFVDRRGRPEAASVLYVHGGPAQGCWDFMGSVGDALAEDLDVIGIDQPGVLRSDPLHVDAEVNTDLLVASYEDVREWLGIDQGGRGALCRWWHCFRLRAVPSRRCT